ncbi:hypothetical protein AURDEDRAFT_161019 [Auricularia subglabra TFB-10046 SS5]|nr:hypothetical protein AURDEDRAFT_161019 [Auricularia subglabra TFB-10046 SS5]
MPIPDARSGQTIAPLLERNVNIEEVKELRQRALTNMHTSDPQSDVFLAYCHDIKSQPRLSAVDSFMVCGTCGDVIPCAHTGKGDDSTFFVCLADGALPVRKAELLPLQPTHLFGRSFSTCAFVVQDHAWTKKAWVADLDLEFKLWLTHHVLGLSDMACMDPTAHTSAQVLSRYLFVKSAAGQVLSLGWEYRHATIKTVSVHEAAGMSNKLWKANVETFAHDVEGFKLIFASL